MRDNEAQLDDCLARQRLTLKSLGVFSNPNMRVTITLGDLEMLVDEIDALQDQIEDDPCS